ncbi:MAG: hypothetical protein WCS15_06105 [Prevotella sp.]
MLKESIKAALKTTYANFGLGDSSLSKVAEYIGTFVSNEEDIATAIQRDDVKTIIKAIQSDTDGLRTAKLNAEKALEDYKKDHPEVVTPQSEQKITDDSKLSNLEKEINSLKESLKERDSKAETAIRVKAIREKLKSEGSENDNILDLVLTNGALKEGESEDEATSRFKSEYDSTYKKFYGNGPVPPAEGSHPSPYKKGDDDAFKAAMEAEGLIPKSETN